MKVKSRVIVAKCENPEDAKLIAAAPEMLYALKKLVNLKKYKEDNGKDDYYSEARPFAWKYAVEAIKKATE